MRMTVFRLMELAKEFLVHVNLQRNNLLKETLLMDELNNRELNELLIKNIQALDKKLISKKLKRQIHILLNIRLSISETILNPEIQK